MLRPYLFREGEAFCFRPCDSERERLARRTDDRTTPISYGNRPGTNKVRRPKRKAGEKYTTDSYRRAIHRACIKAGIPKWSPNQLRHTAATEVRKKFGLDAAQTVLGHARADTTEIYAEPNHEKARAVMREVG